MSKQRRKYDDEDVTLVESGSAIFDQSYDVVADVFGRTVSQKLKKNTPQGRKTSLMKELGLSMKDMPNYGNDDDLSPESTMSFMQTIQPTAAPKKGLAVNQNDEVYEINLVDVNHPTYNPPLGSYEFYKDHDRYVDLLEEFKSQDKKKECQSLEHIWQQKLKSDLLHQYRWPPKLRSDIFWTYGYYRDLFPVETRLNLEISDMVSKSLENMLFGPESRERKNIPSNKHDSASGFNFETMKTKNESGFNLEAMKTKNETKLKSKMQEAEAAKQSADDRRRPEKQFAVEKEKPNQRERKNPNEGIMNFFDETEKKVNERAGKDKKETRGRRSTASSITFDEIPKYSKLEISNRSDSPSPRSESINQLFEKGKKGKKGKKHKSSKKGKKKKHGKSHKIKSESTTDISKDKDSIVTMSEDKDDEGKKHRSSKKGKKHRKSHKNRTGSISESSQDQVIIVIPSGSINELFDKEYGGKKSKSSKKDKKHKKSKKSKDHGH